MAALYLILLQKLENDNFIIPFIANKNLLEKTVITLRIQSILVRTRTF